MNFQDPDTTVSGPADFHMKLPDDKVYKDVNSDTQFVGLTNEQISGYLDQFEKTLSKDAKDLCKERFLRFVRIANENNVVFVKSQCRAQMKKSVTYTIDVSLCGSTGSIMEAQCECAAGMGPEGHCKHICALLHCLQQFTSTDEIITEETCTEKLQTFHHCKKYKGSPVKCSDLKLSTASTSSRSVNFDPRPQECIEPESYKSFFRNHVLSSGFNDIPLQQLYEPANVLGSSHDHDYLIDTPEENFLAANNISSISAEAIADTQKVTTGQSKNKSWAKERVKRIHSSNFGRICKLTERTDKKKYAKSLTTGKRLNTAPIKHGHKYEPVAIKRYEAEKKLSVDKCGIFVSKSHPYLASTPDGIVGDDKVLEVKCPYVAKEREINEVTVPFLQSNSESGQLQLNQSHDYYYQVQGQMFCSERSSCDFCVYTLKDFITINVERNEEFIETMVDKLEEFYQDYFKDAVIERHFYQNSFDYSFN